MPNQSVIISDLQLSNKTQTRWIFLNGEIDKSGRELEFDAQTVRFLRQPISHERETSTDRRMPVQELVLSRDAD